MAANDIDGQPNDDWADVTPRPGDNGLYALAQRLAAVLEGERDRWFLWVPVLMATGIALYFAARFEPSFMAVGTVGTMTGIAFLIARGMPVVSLVTGALLAITSGALLAKVRTELVQSPRLASIQRNIDVRGYVILSEPRAGAAKRVTISVTTLGEMDARERPARVRVRFAKEADWLKPGDAVHFKATLSPPGRPVLPGDYDFARAAFFKRIGAVGFATSVPVRDDTLGVQPFALQLWAPIERVRQDIGRRVTAALPGERGAIAAALINGERGGISEDTNTAYRDAGIFHILSISGLHMAIMGGAVFVLVRFLLALVPSIALRFVIKKWAAAAAAAGSLGYLLISGGEFATVRSYVMISVMFFAILIDRPALAMRNVAISALAIILVWPESVLDVGFQMSFAAVIALVSAYEAIRERGHDEVGRVGSMFRALRWTGLLIGGIVLTTVIASLAVAPFAAFHFHKSQQFAVLANLIAVPVCNFLVMPAALATLLVMPFGLEGGPLWVMGYGIDVMNWCARLVAALPGAVARISAIPTSAFVSVVAGGLWLTLWRGRRRYLGILPILVGLALAPTTTRPDLIVAREGRLVAVRQASGQLSAMQARGVRFEMSRVLEHDGDGRDPELAIQGDGFRCDEVGCTTRVKGVLIAVTRDASGLADDCTRAAIVISQLAVTPSCLGPGLVIDRRAVAAAGGYVVLLGASGPIVTTVTEARGARPWTTETQRALRDRPRRDGYRLDRFTSPVDLSEIRQKPESETRPDVEGE